MKKLTKLLCFQNKLLKFPIASHNRLPDYCPPRSLKYRVHSYPLTTDISHDNGLPSGGVVFKGCEIMCFCAAGLSCCP